MGLSMTAIGKFLIHRPEALAVSHHASRALQLHCCKPILFYLAIFHPLKIFGTLDTNFMVVSVEAQPITIKTKQ